MTWATACSSQRHTLSGPRSSASQNSQVRQYHRSGRVFVPASLLRRGRLACCPNTTHKRVLAAHAYELDSSSIAVLLADTVHHQSLSAEFMSRPPTPTCLPDLQTTVARMPLSACTLRCACSVPMQ